LPVHVIGDVAGSENARHAGGRGKPSVPLLMVM
jgi:hypothetical protein